MAVFALIKHTARPGAWVCRQCQLRQPPPRVLVRSISQGHIRKTIEAEWQWKEQAKQIEAGRKLSFLSMLEERGFVHQVTGDRDVLDKVMTNKRIAAYCGVDPTAPSIHLGHLLPLMVIFWMYLHGFHGVTVLGGATAKIGDPSGRTTARSEQNSATRKLNMAQMHIQLKKLWAGVERVGRRHGYVREWAWRRSLMNNNEWLNKLDVTEYFRVMGPAIRLGSLLARDTVKKRQENGEGMSLAEFAYPTIQAWDWWHLFNRNRIQLQIGGQDQYGNIVTGINAINHIRANTTDLDTAQKVIDRKKPKNDYLLAPYGLTVPLLTTSSGEKFGKSAGNALWLNQEMLSSYDLYGYLVGTSDADVERYLKLFTFLPLHTISDVVEQHKKNPKERVAQHLLAQEVVDLAHGAAAAEKAGAQHRAAFAMPTEGGAAVASSPEKVGPSFFPPHDRRNFVNASSGNKFAPPVTAENAPPVTTYLPESLVYGNNFPRLLWAAGLVASKSEGHRLVTQHGAYVAGQPGQIGSMGDSLKFTPIKHMDNGVPEQFIFDGNQLLIRIGKWKIKAITVIPDEEFAARGLTAPGWGPEKAEPESREGEEKTEE